MSTLDDILNLNEEKPKKAATPTNQVVAPAQPAAQPTANGVAQPTQSATTTAPKAAPAQPTTATATTPKQATTTAPTQPTAPTTPVPPAQTAEQTTDDDSWVKDQENGYEEMNGNAETPIATTTPLTPAQKQANESAARARNLEDVLQGMYDAEMKRNEQDAEYEAKMRKKQARDERIAAIGDGISALANLFGTYNGARNAYDPKNTLSAKTKERYDKLLAEREQKRQNYLNAANGKYKILRGRESADEAKASAEASLEVAKAKAANQAAKDEADKNYKANMLILKAQGNQAAQDAAAKNYKLKQDDLELKAKHYNAMEQNAAAKEARLAGNGSGSGSGSKGYYTMRLGNGQVVKYPKSKVGAINSLASTMAVKARQAGNRYREQGNYDLADKYEALSDQIAKTSSPNAIHALVQEYIAEFPTMQNDIRRILGIASNKPQKKAQTKTNTTRQASYGGVNFN